MSRWFLVQTKPNADAMARRNLKRQRFTTFQPLEQRTRIKGGRFVSYRRPVFPGYLFASYPEASTPWSVVRSTYGVSRLVSFAGRPSVVPDSVIADLRAACNDEDVIDLSQEVGEGEEIEVASGSFAGFVGEVLRIAPNDRVLVLLDFIGKKTRVSLPMAGVRRASGAAIASGGGR
ncbi:transcriptional activator RfaH [Erythrobacter sp.]|uniref:transcriptional activator RfaH n=1 Tax=Erythrobacter sp. TaxID=1042 RepID=UPI001425DC53|nr:transcriptional activator RfaH [Erythrobacter sp.]QIQ87528.1 MAG: transcriptional activator RfaH [Erythrobacter sp.]